MSSGGTGIRLDTFGEADDATTRLRDWPLHAAESNKTSAAVAEVAAFIAGKHVG